MNTETLNRTMRITYPLMILMLALTEWTASGSGFKALLKEPLFPKKNKYPSSASLSMSHSSCVLSVSDIQPVQICDHQTQDSTSFVNSEITHPVQFIRSEKYKMN